MIRRPPRSTHCISSAASDVYKRQSTQSTWGILFMDNCMDEIQIFQYILRNYLKYHGDHNQSWSRGESKFKQLSTLEQFQLIYKILGNQIREKLLQSVCLNIPKFGAFCFQIQKLKNGLSSDIFEDLIYKKSFVGQYTEQNVVSHHIRPCFIPDPSLVIHLQSQSNKDELDVSQGLTSIYQKGFQIQACNIIDIARQSNLPKKMVESAVTNLAKGICDLVKLSKNIVLNFGFCQIKIANKALKYQFSQEFCSQINDNSFELNKKKSKIPTKDIIQNDQNIATARAQKQQQVIIQTLYKKSECFKESKITYHTKQIAASSKDLISINKLNNVIVYDTKKKNINYKKKI
eukprot:TRINITY_DN19943_c0_g1_i2.p1 TRINITY_DN19943_c0_g1~~TRINITY_DN19943_c0_g1_i2.p1  ORF type:complete len:347 (-),score=70.51 TRINITY_DN19943_c0_g1_i2:105-1145(-)